MDILIQIINRTQNHQDGETEPKITTTTMKTIPGDCGRDLRQRVADFINSPPDRVRLIFAGSAITDSVDLNSLQLGNTTTLHAIITAQQTSLSESSGPTTPITPDKLFDVHGHVPQASSFFVLCPVEEFGKIKKGKLRVRCSRCKSGSLLVTGDPTCWNDVMCPERLSGTCEANLCDKAYAEFYFKCSECSDAGRVMEGQTAVPLPQIRLNIYEKECAVCGEIPPDSSVDFICEPVSHLMCLECFVAYGERGLQQRRMFKLDPNFGFTLPCPVVECSGLIQDPHHFRLLGRELYEKFKSSGAEISLLQSGGLFCPDPKCGSAFFIDDTSSGEMTLESGAENLNRLVLCPSCAVAICRSCKSQASDCICDEEGELSNLNQGQEGPDHDRDLIHANRQSLSTIKKVCKSCPRCHVSTEKNGGCNHMYCVQCAFQWCWLCQLEWTEDCQWEHWFA